GCPEPPDQPDVRTASAPGRSRSDSSAPRNRTPEQAAATGRPPSRDPSGSAGRAGPRRHVTRESARSSHSPPPPAQPNRERRDTHAEKSFPHGHVLLSPTSELCPGKPRGAATPPVR